MQWIGQVKCTHNAKGQYNQPVMKSCLIVGLIRWKDGEWKVDRYKCKQCGAIFQQGRERIYTPITLPRVAGGK